MTAHPLTMTDDSPTDDDSQSFDLRVFARWLCRLCIRRFCCQPPAIAMRTTARPMCRSDMACLGVPVGMAIPDPHQWAESCCLGCEEHPIKDTPETLE